MIEHLKIMKNCIDDKDNEDTVEKKGTGWITTKNTCQQANG